MNDDEAIEKIKFSKYQALFSLIFPLALYESVANLLKQGALNHDYRWYILFVIVAWYLIWNFIRITVFMLIGTPAIVITKGDITLNQIGQAIEWEDITDINITESGGRGRSYYLVISVKDPWKYISVIRNPLTRYYRWYTKDYGYGPFSINLGIVEGNEYDVFETVERYYHKYRRGLSG